ncbi:MAG: CBS domain-containing protein [Planctomycetes bacterium]|nr:CBS domain-containing protein [Planctomycetota bacterium]
MKIDDLMTRDVSTIHPDDNLATAARKMWEHDCGILPVVHPEDGTLVGVLTDRDVCISTCMEGAAPGEIPVVKAMSRQLFTCPTGSDLAAVHNVMRRNQVRRVPVVDGERKIVGLISINDLALAADAATGPKAGEQRAEVARTLAAVCRHHVAAGA